MPVTLSTLKHGLILFWSLWFTLVFLANLFDGLKVWGILSQEWPFASGNYAHVAEATSVYSLPRWLTNLMFAGVTLWEGVAALAFWKAFCTYRAAGTGGLADVYVAFALGLGLWLAFMIADEIFRTYQQQTIHVLLFIGQSATLLMIHL